MLANLIDAHMMGKKLEKPLGEPDPASVLNGMLSSAAVGYFLCSANCHTMV